MDITYVGRKAGNRRSLPEFLKEYSSKLISVNVYRGINDETFRVSVCPLEEKDCFSFDVSREENALEAAEKVAVYLLTKLRKEKIKLMDLLDQSSN